MWDIFKDWIFDIIQFFYNFCHDWGLAIIIVTIIFRIIVAPLMHKQAKLCYAEGAAEDSGPERSLS